MPEEWSAPEVAAERSRATISTGGNCAESVLQSVSAAIGLPEDAVPSSSALGWTGGIDQSGCLCGALAASICLAGIAAARESGSEWEQGMYARQLSRRIRDAFADRWNGTCCRVVRGGLPYDTPECRAHCEEVTAFTCDLAVKVLGSEGVDPSPLEGRALMRWASALAVGCLLGAELAVVAGLVAPALALPLSLIALVGACLWAIFSLSTRRRQRRLARPGRILAGVAMAVAFILAGEDVLVGGASARAATRLGTPALAVGFRLVWLVAIAVCVVPFVVNLVRRHGSF